MGSVELSELDSFVLLPPSPAGGGVGVVSCLIESWAAPPPEPDDPACSPLALKVYNVCMDNGSGIVNRKVT